MAENPRKQACIRASRRQRVRRCAATPRARRATSASTVVVARRISRCQRTRQRPSRAQSANSDQVADARKPASAIACRSDSSQCGSNALLRASAHAAHTSTSRAASAAITIAPVDSGRSPLPAFARAADVCAGAVVCAPGVAGVLVAGAVAAGGVVAGGVVAVLAVAGGELLGAVAPPEGAYVVVGVVAAPAAPAAPAPAAVLGARAEAGTGNVGVLAGLAARAIEGPPNVIADPSTSSASPAASARDRRRSCSAGGGVGAITAPMLTRRAACGREQIVELCERVGEHALGRKARVEHANALGL